MVKKRKSWVEKLHDSRGLPKVEKITEKMSKRWGTGTCYSGTVRGGCVDEEGG